MQESTSLGRTVTIVKEFLRVDLHSCCVFKALESALTALNSFFFLLIVGMWCLPCFWPGVVGIQLQLQRAQKMVNSWAQTHAHTGTHSHMARTCTTHGFVVSKMCSENEINLELLLVCALSRSEGGIPSPGRNCWAGGSPAAFRAPGLP